MNCTCPKETEIRRLKILRDLAVLNSGEEEEFDDLTAMASRLCETPVAMITFLDANCQWAKSCHGEFPRTLPREESFCDHTIRQNEVFTVPDATADSRFADLPVVSGETAVRFYAGAPLVTREGVAVGAVCVLDTKPRVLTQEVRNFLLSLARQTSRLLETRRAASVDTRPETVVGVDLTGNVGEAFSVWAESVPHMVWMADPEGELIYFNRYCLEYFQCTAEQMKNWTTLQVVHPEDQPRCEASLAEAMREGNPYESEMRVRRAADGEWRWHLERALPQKDAEGKILRWFGTLTDIHDQKAASLQSRDRNVRLEQTVAERTAELTLLNKRLREEIKKHEIVEQSLYESDSRFKAFMHDNPAVAWMKDAEGRYVYVNRTLLKIYGFTEEQVLGKTDWKLLPEPVARQLRQNDEKVLSSGRPVEAMERIPVAENDYHFWLVWKFPFADAGGNKYVGGLAFDVTERERAEEALRHSEERYRALVEKARDSIFTMDARGKFQSMNDAFTQISGWEVEDWLRRPFQEIVHVEDVARAEEYFLTVLSGREPSIFELRVRTKDGGVIPMEFTVTPLYHDGVVNGVLGIGRDVRERRQLEEQLRQMQKMDSVGRLAAGIAHDFNNILTVLKGYVSSLQLEKGLPESVREAVIEIGNSTERASGLTRQLLLFSRKQSIRPRSLDLNGLVENVGGLLRRLLGENIDLRVAKGDVPATVKADPVMIEQILLNLAVNARDAMPDGGRLSISIEIWSPAKDELRANAEARPGRFAKITVSDTGCGISPAVREKLFEPFFTTKEVGSGTGLGLATVYGIVKQHEGWIEVESEEGVGATFRIHLPVEAPADSGKPTVSLPESEVEAGTRGGRRVLVVEDEGPLRDMVRMVLEDNGYKVVVAENGPHALELWRQRDGGFDLLLTDLMMPEGMTGGQLADRLREEHPRLKVIVTSGYRAEITGGNLCRDPGLVFLQKPYLPGDLIKLIEKTLAG